MFANREFYQGHFLLEYTGVVLRGAAANTQKDNSYNFHFKYEGENYW